MPETAKTPEPLDIHLGALLRWVLPPVLGVAAFGVLPTWLLTGWAGVTAGWVAVVLVLAVMVGTGSATVYAARQGVGPASTTFLGSSLLRMVLCPALVGLVMLVTDLPSKPMAVWLVIAYIMCLGLEVAWLVVALRRQTRLAAKPPDAADAPDSSGLASNDTDDPSLNPADETHE